MKCIPYVDFRNQVNQMKIQSKTFILLGFLLAFSVGLQAQDLVHTVKKKETLYSISKQYQVTVAELKAWNNLSSNTIKIGQELRVGENVPAEGAQLDSYDVAMLGLNRGKMSVDEAAHKLSLIADLEREQARKAQASFQFTDFDNETSEFEQEGVARARGFNPKNLKYYQVKPGDDLFSIADTYEVSVQDLQYWNNIQGVQAGDVIIVQDGVPVEEKRSPVGLTRSQNMGVPAQATPVWYEPVNASTFNPTPVVSPLSLRGASSPQSTSASVPIATASTGTNLSAFDINEVKGAKLIYSRNMGRPDTDVVPMQTFQTSRGDDPFSPQVLQEPQPEGPMVVLPNPSSNQVRETGGYGVFSIPGYNHFRFYGAHKILPVGSKVQIDIPNNPGHLEVTIVQQLPANSPYVIALSPSVVDLLKSSGSNAQVSVMY